MKSTKIDFKNQTLYIGIDIHKKHWTVSIFSKHIECKTFSQPPEPMKLVSHLHRHYPNATYKAVYEAGYSGFWICDELQERGIDCIVVNPADVPTKGKERRHKNDRVDSRKLARELRDNSLLRGIHIPTPSIRADRSLTRIRTQMIRKQTRCKNQIKSLLSYYGNKLDPNVTDKYWSRKFIAWLQAIEFEHTEVRTTLNLLIDELLYFRKSLLRVTRQIRELSRTPRYAKNVQLLLTVPGVGLITAMILLTEIIRIDRFQSLDQLSSYFGLIPTEDSSGDRQFDGSITPCGNRFLKHIIVEAAWVAVRKDPALNLKFEKLARRMKKQEAIIICAKSLINRIRYVLKNKQGYVLSVAA
jgi:transposase